MRLVRTPHFRHGLSAWVAILALVVQALLPNLVAAEIDFSQDAEAGIFDQCAFGHSDENADASGEAGHHQHHGGDCGLCPICIALLSSSAFATPTAISVPLPGSNILYRVTAHDPHAPELVAQTFYRSRAPPIG